MDYVDKIRRTNKFQLAENVLKNCKRNDLLLHIEEPVEVSRGKRCKHFKLKDTDFDDASDIFKLVLN